VTPEEAIRAYTSSPAYAAFLEDRTGVLAPGRWADVTIMDIDPMVIGTSDAPEQLLDGRIVFTVVGGEVVFEALSRRASS
jgi:predicted amidohydrolase YtcJ